MIEAKAMFSMKITGRDGQVYVLLCDHERDSLDMLEWELLDLVETGLLDTEDAEAVMEAIENFCDE